MHLPIQLNCLTATGAKHGVCNDIALGAMLTKPFKLVTITPRVLTPGTYKLYLRTAMPIIVTRLMAVHSLTHVFE